MPAVPSGHTHVCKKTNKGTTIGSTLEKIQEELMRDEPDKRLIRDVLLFTVNHRTARLLCCVFLACEPLPDL